VAERHRLRGLPDSFSLLAVSVLAPLDRSKMGVRWEHTGCAGSVR
jgi:hypothetical protein